MKEIGLPFQGDMVRAILDNLKTLTSRLRGLELVNRNPERWLYRGSDANGHVFNRVDGKDVELIQCPYGRAGDRIYVKENFRLWDRSIDCVEVEYVAGGDSLYVEMDHRQKRAIKSLHARDESGKKITRSCIFMPRWASRITLEIVNIWPSRLQDMSGEEALAEGVSVGRCGCEVCAHSSKMCPADASAHVMAYAELWDRINGKPRRKKVKGKTVVIPGHPWSQNDWVWRVQFKRL